MEKPRLIERIVLFTLISFAFSACNHNKKVDFTSAKEAILKLHHAQRDYHFNKDSIAFANQLSDDFISVNKGEISSPKKNETITRYHGYFSSVEFLKWDDVSKPVIKFSDDGSMAYTIVDKIVATTHKDNQGNLVEGQTHFAWTAIYKKHGNEWKIDCVTSTNKPIKE
jgi:hypothetical protein